MLKRHLNIQGEGHLKQKKENKMIEIRLLAIPNAFKRQAEERVTIGSMPFNPLSH